MRKRQPHRAFITGITGQDGSLLAEQLLTKDYEVHGLVHRDDSDERDNIRAIEDRLTLHVGDLRDTNSLEAAIRLCFPTEVYNFAAAAYVPDSFADSAATMDVTGVGAVRVLEALRAVGPREARFYQASSSEMLGASRDIPHSESSPLTPFSPYGAAKAYAHLMVGYYRRRGQFCCAGIAFNHESARRGRQYVTRKITRAAAMASLGYDVELVLGNVEARRYWGSAIEYVDAMWRMLQQPEPTDYVLATGKEHSVRDVMDLAFFYGARPSSVVEWSPDQMRPLDPPVMVGNAARAKRDLGWRANTELPDLIRAMVEHDIDAEKRGRADEIEGASGPVDPPRVSETGSVGPQR